MTSSLRVLAISDLHGDLKAAHAACGLVKPDLILSCGDWGDEDQVTLADLAAFQKHAPLYSTFGNHDPIEMLKALHNPDGTSVLLPQGSPVLVAGLHLAGIGGIWAKSHAKPHYVTDQDVADAARRSADAGPIDILLTHGCPIGLADMTPSGRHGGQRCFLEANKTILPRLHLCGHLHLAQERILKDGRKVLNVGATPDGSFVVVDFDASNRSLEARLERLPCAVDSRATPGARRAHFFTVFATARWTRQPRIREVSWRLPSCLCEMYRARDSFAAGRSGRAP